MKRTARNILIMLAVLVVLGGAAAALFFTQPQEGQEESSAVSSPVEEVLRVSPSEVVGIQVENSQDSFQLIPVKQPESETASSGGNASSAGEEEVDFTVEGLEGYDLNTVGVTSAAESMLSIYATKNLGEVSAPEEFGLSGKGEATVTIRYRDGGSQTLTVGSTAGGAMGRYLLKDGVCYVVSTINENLLGRGVDFLNTTVYTVADLMKDTVDSEGSSTQEKAADVLNNIEFSGTNFPETIRITSDSSRVSGYVMTAPIKAETGTDKFGALTTSLKSLTADGVAAVGVTEEKQGEYGLAEPFAQIDFDLNGEKHSLRVSEKDGDGNRYLMADNSDVVYTVASGTVSGWAELSLMDLRTSYVWLPNIMEVKKLTLTLNDQESSFDVTRTKNEEKSTESNTVYDLTVQGANGKEITYSATYQPFYQKLIAIAVLNTDPVEYSGDPVFRAEYAYFDGRADNVVEFYAIPGQDRYAAVLDGIYSGQVRKSSLDNVTTLIEKLNANEALKETD